MYLLIINVLYFYQIQIQPKFVLIKLFNSYGLFLLSYYVCSNAATVGSSETVITTEST